MLLLRFWKVRSAPFCEPGLFCAVLKNSAHFCESFSNFCVRRNYSMFLRKKQAPFREDFRQILQRSCIFWRKKALFCALVNLYLQFQLNILRFRPWLLPHPHRLVRPPGFHVAQVGQREVRAMVLAVDLCPRPMRFFSLWMIAAPKIVRFKTKRTISAILFHMTSQPISNELNIELKLSSTELRMSSNRAQLRAQRAQNLSSNLMFPSSNPKVNELIHPLEKSAQYSFHPPGTTFPSPLWTFPTHHARSGQQQYRSDPCSRKDSS